MASSSAPSPATPPALARTAARLRWRSRLWALGLLALGLVLLAANLGALPAEAAQMVRLGWPALLVAAGLWLLARGLPAAPAGAGEGTLRRPTFAVERGGYERAELVVRAGADDLQVRAFAGASQLVVGDFPALRGPALDAAGNAARLRLSARDTTPLLAGRPWAVALAKGLPWSLDLRSSLGDLDLDLKDLSASRLSAYSTLGHVDLTLPACGQAEVAVRLVLGDLTVRVPEAMAVKVRLRAGPLARVRPDARRFVCLAPGEWASPLFAVSAERCTLTVDLWAGDLTLV